MPVVATQRTPRTRWRNELIATIVAAGAGGVWGLRRASDGLDPMSLAVVVVVVGGVFAVAGAFVAALLGVLTDLVHGATESSIQDVADDLTIAVDPRGSGPLMQLWLVVALAVTLFLMAVAGLAWRRAARGQDGGAPPLAFFEGAFLAASPAYAVGAAAGGLVVGVVMLVRRSRRSPVKRFGRA